MPVFYTELGVPDTRDGRLEIIQLHVILLLRRLQRGDEAAKAVGQALFDTFFEDVDGSLREAGVGDLSVGKWIRKLGEQFYARATAVEVALEIGDRDGLAATLESNLYADGAADGLVAELVDYLFATDAAMGCAGPTADDRHAALQFPPLERIR
ncbi:MAG: ubiquinol-cytochrome C chaperone family protein [Pseudomonadota bacterium]